VRGAPRRRPHASAPEEVAIVRVERFSKVIGDRRVLSDISLSLGEGQIVCLLGPNGAGKSTLMKAVLGLLRPASGTVAVFGLDPFARGPSVRRRCGVVPEDDLFYDDETALRNLSLWGDLHGMRRARAAAAVEELSFRLGLEDALGEKVATLSKGMKRRLSLIRGLMNDPELLLLDEPTSGLDMRARTELRTIIRERVRERGRAALVSSHELDEVRRLEPMVKILVSGRIVAETEGRDTTAIESAYLEALEEDRVQAALSAKLLPHSPSRARKQAHARTPPYSCRTSWPRTSPRPQRLSAGSSPCNIRPAS